MEEDKKTMITLGAFFATIGVLIILLIILSIYIQIVN